MAHDVFAIAGTTQGPFIIEEAVAEGGFGVVYKALHGAFRAPVALKCLKIPNIPEAHRANFLEKFREEAEMLFRLSANIPEVVRPLHYDVFTLSSGLIVPFIALEWLEGRTLWSFIEDRAASGQKPVDCLEAARMLTPVARALEVAHRFPGPSGTICVIHRDIKPANIFLAKVRGNEITKILDFGIARARDNVEVMAGQMTRTSSEMPLAFTPRYGAPEQWAPKRFGTTGPWTDVWGLAITYLELLAGRPAIEGDPVAIMGTVLDEKRRPTPRNEGIRVPDVIEAVMQRALALDPRDRPVDVGMFWDEMEQALAAVTRSYAPAPSRRVSGALPAARPFGAESAPISAPAPHSAPATRTGPAPFSSSSPLTGPAPFSSPAPLSGPSPFTSIAVEEDLPEEPQPPRSVNPARTTGHSASARLGLSLDVVPPSRSPDLPPPSVSSSFTNRDFDLGATRRTGPAPNRSMEFDDDAPPRRSIVPRPLAQPIAEPPPSEPQPTSSGRAPSSSMAPEPAPEVGTMLGVPVLLAVAGGLVRLSEGPLSDIWFQGERVQFGPIRLTWIAGTLIFVGAVLAFARVLRYLVRQA